MDCRTTTQGWVCGYKNVSSKIVELEEELRVVGNNLKSLELSEEKALEREDVCAQQIRELDARLKEVGICPRVHMCPYIYMECAQPIRSLSNCGF